jgi:nucleoside-diphosphate-sugar epimerase
MKYYITGPNGMVARNLKVTLESMGHKVFTDVELFAGSEFAKFPKTGEACIHRNSEEAWSRAFDSCGVEVVVHNAAVVGTDVVALNPEEAVLSNIQGTHNIVRAANRSGAGICYLGTTVIYDTPEYQDREIVEDSQKYPRTYYGVQKLAGEQIVKSMANHWTVIRPLFAYGGLGDMNSLIAKSIYAHLSGRDRIDMFLDPTKVKDYLHVSDFCSAIELVCRESTGPGWGSDWNVAAETSRPAIEVLEEIDKILPGVKDRVKWYPTTDYLGNHRLSSRKIREKLGWKPRLDLSQGIRETLSWIQSASDYNPLKYLDEAAGKKVDLLQHFPKVP